MSAAWSVTFENPDICALRGSSVEFRCSYSYPDEESVRGTAWDRGMNQNGVWERVRLSGLPSYNGRFEYQGDHAHNCSLVLRDLQENDTGYYYFWFDTDKFGRRSKTSVFLSVTGKTDLRSQVSVFRLNVFLWCKSCLCLISRAESHHTP